MDVTPWSSTLFEKLMVIQLVNKFSEFYETRRFITVYTKVHPPFDSISAKNPSKPEAFFGIL
jgi:hypothetical protein